MHMSHLLISTFCALAIVLAAAEPEPLRLFAHSSLKALTEVDRDFPKFRIVIEKNFEVLKTGKVALFVKTPNEVRLKPWQRMLASLQSEYPVDKSGRIKARYLVSLDHLDVIAALMKVVLRFSRYCRERGVMGGKLHEQSCAEVLPVARATLLYARRVLFATEPCTLCSAVIATSYGKAHFKKDAVFGRVRAPMYEGGYITRKKKDAVFCGECAHPAIYDAVRKLFNTEEKLVACPFPVPKPITEAGKRTVRKLCTHAMYNAVFDRTAVTLDLKAPTQQICTTFMGGANCPNLSEDLSWCTDMYGKSHCRQLVLFAESDSMSPPFGLSGRLARDAQAFADHFGKFVTLHTTMNRKNEHFITKFVVLVNTAHVTTLEADIENKMMGKLENVTFDRWKYGVNPEGNTFSFPSHSQGVAHIVYWQQTVRFMPWLQSLPSDAARAQATFCQFESAQFPTKSLSPFCKGLATAQRQLKQQQQQLQAQPPTVAPMIAVAPVPVVVSAPAAVIHPPPSEADLDLASLAAADVPDAAVAAPPSDPIYDHIDNEAEQLEKQPSVAITAAEEADLELLQKRPAQERLDKFKDRFDLQTVLYTSDEPVVVPAPAILKRANSLDLSDRVPAPFLPPSEREQMEDPITATPAPVPVPVPAKSTPASRLVAPAVSASVLAPTVRPPPSDIQ